MESGNEETDDHDEEPASLPVVQKPLQSSNVKTDDEEVAGLRSELQNAKDEVSNKCDELHKLTKDNVNLTNELSAALKNHDLAVKQLSELRSKVEEIEQGEKSKEADSNAQESKYKELQKRFILVEGRG